MKIKSLILVLAALFFLILSPAANSKSYRSTLLNSTKRGQLYDLTTWNAELIWKATFFTDEFRAAFAKKEAKLKYLSPDEAEKLDSFYRQRAEEGWEFFIAMYTKKDYKLFQLGDASFWETLLTSSSGESVKPISVEKLSATPFYLTMFPYLNRWCKIYRVIFPKIDLGDDAELTLRSVVGSSSLKWNKISHRPER